MVVSVPRGILYVTAWAVMVMKEVEREEERVRRGRRRSRRRRG